LHLVEPSAVRSGARSSAESDVPHSLSCQRPTSGMRVRPGAALRVAATT
jgi:hypothetical protein